MVLLTLPANLEAVGALGSLASGASAIAHVVDKNKSEDKILQETIRHN